MIRGHINAACRVGRALMMQHRHIFSQLDDQAHSCKHQIYKAKVRASSPGGGGGGGAKAFKMEGIPDEETDGLFVGSQDRTSEAA